MPDRLALIIANGDFNDPKLDQLRTPTRDAEALAAVLGDPAIGAFDVKLLVDQPEGLVRRTVARFYTRRTRRDLLLLYYSGHGIRDAHGDLYLATQDTEMDIPSGSSLSASFVRERIRKSSSRRKVVVLDCCHSGAFGDAKAALGDSAGTKDAFAGSGYGQVILTASDALEYAWQGDAWLGEGHPSVFTHFLVEGLRTGAADLVEPKGQISLDELYRYAYDQMLRSGAKQTPQRFLEIEGDIVVAKAPRPEGTLPSWIPEALASASFSARLAAVGELAQLIQGADRALAAAARAALARVRETDDNPAIRGAAVEALGDAGVDRSAAVAVKETVPPIQVVAEPPEKPDVLTLTSPIHLVLVHVPAGGFWMGSDPRKVELILPWSQPHHRVKLPEFYIGKYPITNAQYEAFVQATGHRAPEHWENGRAPADKAAHPVVYVSWHDARAFCVWLSQDTGKEVRLPSEAEWEKASQGTDGRIYPWGWGYKPPMDDLCNFGDLGGGTTPVGKYSPQGDSPYGCADMAGNVWEWTRSLWRDYPYDPTDGREDLAVGGYARRVLRGGAFDDFPVTLRCDYRHGDNPDSRADDIGFRVVVSSSSRTQ
jgi:formylglycine-generating enzyme required for sulfatase activity